VHADILSFVTQQADGGEAIEAGAVRYYRSYRRELDCSKRENSPGGALIDSVSRLLDVAGDSSPMLGSKK
jgi:hypothetical protein